MCMMTKKNDACKQSHESKIDTIEGVCWSANCGATSKSHVQVSTSPLKVRLGPLKVRLEPEIPQSVPCRSQCSAPDKKTQ